MLHGREKWYDSNDDIFGARPRGIGIWQLVAQLADFFCENFFMDSLTDELLGIKADKFEVGDLVKTKSATDAYGMPLLGIITSVTILKNNKGTVRNCYTVDWIDFEASQMLWHDWYDDDLILIQNGVSC